MPFSKNKDKIITPIQNQKSFIYADEGLPLNTSNRLNYSQVYQDLFFILYIFSLLSVETSIFYILSKAKERKLTTIKLKTAELDC